MSKTIETERLILRPIKESDTPFVFANWANDPEVTRFLTWHPHKSIEDTKAIMANWLRQELEAPSHRFVITLKGRDEPIGMIDLSGLNDGVPEIGYTLSRKHWGKGIMTEACGAYIGYLFDQGFDVIKICANEKNVGSNRVIAKCGFVFDCKKTGPCSPFKPNIITVNWYHMRNPKLAEKDKNEYTSLVNFWDGAFGKNPIGDAPEGFDPEEAYKEIAPSKKLFDAAASLGAKKKVLDYGCGHGWASVIAAKSGCPDVLGVDVALNGVKSAEAFARMFKAEAKFEKIDSEWIFKQKDGVFDGFFCSNVLDVIPMEMAKDIIREAARITTEDASIIFSFNYFAPPKDGSNKIYVDGILRLVSKTDEEWTALFAPYYEVVRLEYFAWPGEQKESRRLFYLKKR
ncbi:MAG: GNAT family N-acetyltransferase [Bacilli bacterium]|nr:GNAT family N-acetyltransferase [Bacilli bacterium]